MNEQNRIPCAVARDLMPLEIDGVASPESGKLLHAHMEGCEDCQKAYARMRADVGEAQHPDILPMRDVMRALWRRLSVRVALVAVAVVLALTQFVLPLLRRNDWKIPYHSIDPQSVSMEIGEETARISFSSTEGRTNGYGSQCWIRSDPDNENLFELHLNFSISFADHLKNLLHMHDDSTDYTYEFDLVDMLGDGFEASGLPDDLVDILGDGFEVSGLPEEAALSAIYYDEADIRQQDGSQGYLLWRSDESRLTLESLAEQYERRAQSAWKQSRNYRKGH